MKKIFWLFLLVVLSGMAISQTTNPAEDQVSVLLTQLSAKEVNARRAAAEQLRTYGSDQRVVPALLKAVDDPSPFVQMAAIDSLGLIRNPAATTKLCEVLASNKNDQIRQSAAIALGYLGDKQSLSSLSKALNDPSDNVKFSAYNSLGHLGAAEAVPALASGLKSEDVRTRRAAISALERISSPTSLEYVRVALADNDEVVLAAAARMVGAFQDTESLPALKKLLDNPAKQVAISAAASLGRLKDGSGLAVAKKIIQEKDPNLRRQAADALGYIGGKESIAILRKVAGEDSDPGVQQAARISLSRLRVPAEEKTPSRGKK